MKFMDKYRSQILTLVGVAIVLVPFYSFKFIDKVVIPEKQRQLGIETVKLMYEFSVPEDILKNHQILSEIISEDEFGELSVDNELRAVNAYYKFGYAESAVHVVDSGENFVIYTLENENIDPTTEWLFLFDTEGGKVCNVREYKLVLSSESEVYAD